MAEEFMVAQALHKSFNEHKVVNGVSFSIDKCEILGFICGGMPVIILF